ncbi:response regulator transcription factor [Streptomyces sp. NPDC002285]|uniref:response regulator transcription factor n=1 Tax=unclassified Streptomyces TaxID=2593676 RepID=UPI00368AEA3E
MSRVSRPGSEGLVPRSASMLTPRECQVLDGIKEGYSNRMVGRVLGISERTVKVHVHSIFIKLGAASRTEAVISGIRNGCISLH